MSKSKPHSIDVFAGNRVRELRLMKGWSQNHLAKKIGVKFQQLQKYESGDNRISASRLYLICQAFDITISEFFRELYPKRRKQGKTIKMLESPETAKLAALFFKMSPGERLHFYRIGKSIVGKNKTTAGDVKSMDKPAANPEAHPVDIFVGKQIWKLRVITNTTQQEIGRKPGMKPQQVQKYEEASSRAFVSRLYLICEVFEVTIPELFEDFYKKGKKKGIMEMIENEDGAKLAWVFFKMPMKYHEHFIGLGNGLVEAG